MKTTYYVSSNSIEGNTHLIKKHMIDLCEEARKKVPSFSNTSAIVFPKEISQFDNDLKRDFGIFIKNKIYKASIQNPDDKNLIKKNVKEVLFKLFLQKEDITLTESEKINKINALNPYLVYKLSLVQGLFVPLIDYQTKFIKVEDDQNNSLVLQAASRVDGIRRDKENGKPRFSIEYQATYYAAVEQEPNPFKGVAQAVLYGKKQEDAALKIMRFPYEAVNIIKSSLEKKPKEVVFNTTVFIYKEDIHTRKVETYEIHPLCSENFRMTFLEDPYQKNQNEEPLYESIITLAPGLMNIDPEANHIATPEEKKFALATIEEIASIQENYFKKTSPLQKKTVELFLSKDQKDKSLFLSQGNLETLRNINQSLCNVISTFEESTDAEIADREKKRKLQQTIQNILSIHYFTSLKKKGLLKKATIQYFLSKKPESEIIFLAQKDLETLDDIKQSLCNMISDPKQSADPEAKIASSEEKTELQETIRNILSIHSHYFKGKDFLKKTTFQQFQLFSKKPTKKMVFFAQKDLETLRQQKESIEDFIYPKKFLQKIAYFFLWLFFIGKWKAALENRLKCAESHIDRMAERSKAAVQAACSPINDRLKSAAQHIDSMAERSKAAVQAAHKRTQRKYEEGETALRSAEQHLNTMSTKSRTANQAMTRKTTHGQLHKANLIFLPPEPSYVEQATNAITNSFSLLFDFWRSVSKGVTTLENTEADPYKKSGARRHAP